MAKNRVISVRVTEQMHATLERLAKADRRPLAQFIELSLEDFLRAKGEWDEGAENGHQ